MKNVVLIALCLIVSLIGLASDVNAQSAAFPATAEQEKNKLKIVAVNTHDLESFPYDAGSIKFIVSSDDTGGAWSLVEIIEMPGYHTNLHRHNHTSEAFYVLEGVLTVRINDKTVEYPAGSYVLIPPGTPHAQGNRGTVPAKLLLTMTPAGFEVSFKDRAELLKKMKPSDPDFRKKRQENAAKGNYDVEFLENWDLKK